MPAGPTLVMFRPGRCAVGWALAAAAAALPGCADRRLTITTEPPGAIVWVNDVELGRSPVSAGFVYYGVYDVRVRHEGYEPWWSGMRARAPWYDWPPIDFFSQMLPLEHGPQVRWHIELQPPVGAGMPREQAEEELRARARAMRAALEAATPGEPRRPDPSPPPADGGDAGTSGVGTPGAEPGQADSPGEPEPTGEPGPVGGGA